MARRALGPSALAVVQAVRAALLAPPAPSAPGDAHYWCGCALCKVRSGSNSERRPGGVVVGCSGGADSMALALACGVVLSGRDDWQVRVVDHGLQPGSEAVAREVVARLVERGLPAGAVAVEVHPGGDGMEAAARTARYAALRQPLAGQTEAPLVLVGHTLDDQAETVLLGLARGSGPASLSGMAPLADGIARPLLGLRRATTEQACAEWGVEVWHDPHNESSDFARVRVRRQLLPLMDELLGPGIPDALARTAELLRADHELLDDLAEHELHTLNPDDPTASLECARAAQLPRALRSRVLRAWLERQGITGLSLERTRAVDALLVDWRGQGAIDLPGGHRVARVDGELLLLRATS